MEKPPEKRQRADKIKKVPPERVKYEAFLIKPESSLITAKIVIQSPVKRIAAPTVQNKAAAILYVPVVRPREI
jgi:hypothetical protein